MCIFYKLYYTIILERRDNMNQEKIGKFITEKRKENKLTQEQLAEQ